MFARRLSALLLALFTLHLNLLGADLACAKHGSAGAKMVMPVDGQAVEVRNAHENVHPPGSADAHAIRHGKNADAHVASVSHQMAATDGSNSNGDNVTEHPPCEVPTQFNCCKALTSCSVVFASEDELQVASAQPVPEMIASGRMTVPPFESAAPEPPPPKA